MAKDTKFNKYVQKLLNARGSYGLEVDGAVGDLTRAAILDFQKRMGLKETGTVNMATLEALRAPVIPPMPRPRPARSDIAGTAPITPVARATLQPMAPGGDAMVARDMPMPDMGAAPQAPMSLAPQASINSGMGMSAKAGPVMPPPEAPEDFRARIQRSMMESNMSRAGHSRELEARRMFEEQNGLGVPFGPSSTVIGAGAGNSPLSLGGPPPPTAKPGPNFSAANDQPQIPDALLQMLQAKIAERNAPQPAMTPDMLKQELMRQIFSMRVGAQ